MSTTPTLTFQRSRLVTVGKKEVDFVITLGSYVANGITCTLAAYLANEVYGISCFGWQNGKASDVYKITYQRAASGAPATGKLHVQKSLAECAAGVDLSDLQFFVTFAGR